MTTAAIIGKSIVIKGELSGQEDLTVEGTVEGKLTLKENNVLVGADGKVMASVFAKVVIVTGRVEGDITATERVELTASGSVKGNIKSPRLVITDGAFFQGSVEMQRGSAVEDKIKPAVKPMGKPAMEVV